MPPKNMDIQIIKWNQHSSKWLACYLKWNILVISKLLVITDGCRFCNSKETDNNNRYILHVGIDFTLCSTAQSKLFVISRILAAKCLSSAKSQPNFLVCVIIRLIRISADFFPAIFSLLQITDWGSIMKSGSGHLLCHPARKRTRPILQLTGPARDVSK